MAYTKTTWANGDTVSAASMNKIEDGIADVANLVTDSGTPGASYFNAENTTFKITKQGNLVIINFTGVTTSAASAWGVIGSIPAAYRPSATTYFPAVQGTTGTAISITNIGNIQNVTALTSGARLTFNAVYTIS